MAPRTTPGAGLRDSDLNLAIAEVGNVTTVQSDIASLADLVRL
jgi:hypothetical protein